MTRRHRWTQALALIALALGCTTEPECASGAECGIPDGGEPRPCEGDCECTTAADCTSEHACVEVSCVEGACFFRVDHDACGSGERCDPSAGCVALGDGGARDAATFPLDAAVTDAAVTDAAVTDAAVADAGPPGCDITSGDPNFQPAGYTQHIVPWTDAFFGNTFPAIDHGGLSPVGSFTFRTSFAISGPPMTGRYISIPFVPDPDSNYLAKWYRSQAIYSRDYRVNYPSDAVYATISPCPGDFRLGDASAPRTDPLNTSCRDYAADGRIYFGTTGGGAQCVLEPGRTYYLNIVFADPYGGLDPSETTCVHESGRCNANFGS